MADSARKVFFLPWVGGEGAGGPKSIHGPVCINLWCRKIGEAAGKSEVLKKARMHLIGIRAFCQVLVLAAGESLLVRRPKAWGLNLGRISPTPFHLVWSSNPFLFKLDFYKSPFFPTFPNWYTIFNCYFIVYFCDVILEISLDSGVGTRHNLADTKTLWWVAPGHWSVVIRECGIFQH